MDRRFPPNHTLSLIIGNMSESVSSSSSTAPSDRDGSSSPAPGPDSVAPEADGYDEYMTGDETAKLPEYGAEGLSVLWEAHDGGNSGLKSTLPVRDFE